MSFNDRSIHRDRARPTRGRLWLGFAAAAVLAIGACSTDVAGPSGVPDDGDLSSLLPSNALPSPGAAGCGASVEVAMDDAIGALESTDAGVDMADVESRLRAVSMQLQAMDLEGSAAEARDAALDAIDEVVAQAPTGQVDQDVTDAAADALRDLESEVC